VKTGGALAGTNPRDSSESTPAKRDLGSREKRMRFESWWKTEEEQASKLGCENQHETKQWAGIHLTGAPRLNGKISGGSSDAPTGKAIGNWKHTGAELGHERENKKWTGHLERETRRAVKSSEREETPVAWTWAAPKRENQIGWWLDRS
jgi:hypothetical protein